MDLPPSADGEGQLGVGKSTLAFSGIFALALTQLHNAKEAGRTYDDLLLEMLQIYNRKKLMDRMEKIETMSTKDLVDIDDL